MTRQATGPLQLLLAALVVSTGCAGLRDFSQRMTQKHHAKKAWHDTCAKNYCGPCPIDYKEGWQSGYYDVARGESGCVPAVPPQKYWDCKFQTPEGKMRVCAWFDGYRDGAAAARAMCACYCAQIPASSTAVLPDRLACLEATSTFSHPGSPAARSVGGGVYESSPAPTPAEPDGPEAIRPGDATEPPAAPGELHEPQSQLDPPSLPAELLAQVEALPPVQEPALIAPQAATPAQSAQPSVKVSTPVADATLAPVLDSETRAELKAIACPVQTPAAASDQPAEAPIVTSPELIVADPAPAAKPSFLAEESATKSEIVAATPQIAITPPVVEPTPEPLPPQPQPVVVQSAPLIDAAELTELARLAILPEAFEPPLPIVALPQVADAAPPVEAVAPEAETPSHAPAAEVAITPPAPADQWDLADDYCVATDEVESAEQTVADAIVDTQPADDGLEAQPEVVESVVLAPAKPSGYLLDALITAMRAEESARVAAQQNTEPVDALANAMAAEPITPTPQTEPLEPMPQPATPAAADTRLRIIPPVNNDQQPESAPAEKKNEPTRFAAAEAKTPSVLRILSDPAVATVASAPVKISPNGSSELRLVTDDSVVVVTDQTTAEKSKPVARTAARPATRTTTK